MRCDSPRCTQLATEAPVFFDQIGDDLPFPAVQPTGHDHQQELEGGGVDHGPQLISRPAGSRPKRSAEKWNTTGSR